MKPTLLFLLTAVLSYGQQPRSMPVPNVTARTNTASKHIERSNFGTTKTAQDIRGLTVSVNVSFFSAPPAPYDVQCFFIAKNGQTRSIFSAVKSTSQALSSAYEFGSDKLAGATREWTAIPFSGTYTTTFEGGDTVNGNFSVLSTSSAYTPGSKFDGWIVRVVAGGKVLKIDSNQPTLLDLATKWAPSLDAAAQKAPVQD